MRGKLEQRLECGSSEPGISQIAASKTERIDADVPVISLPKAHSGGFFCVPKHTFGGLPFLPTNVAAKSYRNSKLNKPHRPDIERLTDIKILI